MKSLLTLILSATIVSGQSTGDYLFQRKTSSGYAAQSVTPQNGKLLSWNGSGQLSNIDPVTSLSWESISGKPSTFAPSSHSHPASEILDSTTAGRALLTASTTKAQRTAISVQYHPYIRTVCCVGTSITDQGNGVATTAGGIREIDYSNGHSGWLRHLLNSSVTYPIKFHRGATNYNHGWPGWKLPGITNGANGYTPADDALKTNADIYILEGGTNDIILDDLTSAADVITNITNYWDKFINAGREVIAFNVLPVGSGDGATKRDKVTTVNAALPAAAAARGITLLDTHSVATKDGSGYATTETLHDGHHPTPAYAHRLAKLAAAPLSSRVGNSCPIPHDSSAAWVTQSNSPSQATTPTGWVLSVVSGTATYSAVTDAGSGPTWQRVTLHNTGTAYSNIGFYCQATSGFAAGDICRLTANIRAASGTFDVRDWTFFVNCYAGGNIATFAMGTGGNVGTGLFDPVTGVFTSPPFVIPASTTAVTWNLILYANDATFDVRNIGVFKQLTNGQ